MDTRRQLQQVVELVCIFELICILEPLRSVDRYIGVEVLVTAICDDVVEIARWFPLARAEHAVLEPTRLRPVADRAEIPEHRVDVVRDAQVDNTQDRCVALFNLVVTHPGAFDGAAEAADAGGPVVFHDPGVILCLQTAEEFVMKRLGRIEECQLRRGSLIAQADRRLRHDNRPEAVTNKLCAARIDPPRP